MKKTVGIVFAMMLLFMGASPLFAVGGSEGSEYPSKPISYVIPFDPGGQSDIAAQVQKAELQEILGTNILIKHNPGAAGAVAWSEIAKSNPDGYTIIGNNLPHIVIQPLVREDAGYQTEDLEPLYLFQTTPIGIAVLADSEWKTLDDLIEYAKANPGKVTIGGSGTHSGHHLALLQLQYLTGTQFTYIPSTGAAPSVANFLGGHVKALFANSDDLVQHREKMNVLAIGTEKEFYALPGVKTFKEQGIKMTAGIDRGVAVAKGTPDAIIRILEKAFDEVCKGEKYVTMMEESGILVQNMKSREFKKYIEEKKAETIAALEVLGEL